MTTVYSVSHSEGATYYPTLAEARKVLGEILAHEAAGDDFERYGAEIQRHMIDHHRFTKRELYCRLLNSEGWAHSTEDVK